MKFATSSFILWRLGLTLIAFIASKIIYFNRDFAGSSPWANFDGMHYLAIAEEGYHQYQQAFFPLFPLTIRAFEPLFGANYFRSAIFVTHAAFLLSLLLFAFKI